MGKTLIRRIRKMEEYVAHSDFADSQRTFYTDEEWLELIESMGKRGLFKHEPDFPRAVQFYRDAI